MPDQCGDYQATQPPVVCGSWTVGPAIGPDARMVRLTQLVRPAGVQDDAWSAAAGTFERIVQAATTSPAPDSVLAVLGGGVQDGVLYLAEAAPTVPSLLDAVSDSGPMAVEQVPPFVHALAAALEPLHGAGLYHGWLSPRNVFPSGQAVRLGGWVWPFVISRLGAAGCLGTWPDLAYVSPEMQRGAMPDAASEVYSAAAMAAFSTSGAAPDGSGSFAAMPAALGHALQRGLSPEPALRYNSVKQMIVDVTVEQAIAMTDQAETNAVPEGGDVPDWARDLLAETTARRDAGMPLVDVPEEAAVPAPAVQTPSAVPRISAAAPIGDPAPAAVTATTVHVEPAARRNAGPAAPKGPVFEWNVGSQEKRSLVPTLIGVLSVLFVILGVAITLIRHH